MSDTATTPTESEEEKGFKNLLPLLLGIGGLVATMMSGGGLIMGLLIGAIAAFAIPKLLDQFAPEARASVDGVLNDLPGTAERAQDTVRGLAISKDDLLKATPEQHDRMSAKEKDFLGWATDDEVFKKLELDDLPKVRSILDKMREGAVGADVQLDPNEAQEFINGLPEDLRPAAEEKLSGMVRGS